MVASPFMCSKQKQGHFLFVNTLCLFSKFQSFIFFYESIYLGGGLRVLSFPLIIILLAEHVFSCASVCICMHTFPLHA